MILGCFRNKYLLLELFLHNAVSITPYSLTSPEEPNPVSSTCKGSWQPSAGTAPSATAKQNLQFN